MAIVDIIRQIIFNLPINDVAGILHTFGGIHQLEVALDLDTLGNFDLLEITIEKRHFFLQKQTSQFRLVFLQYN